MSIEHSRSLDRTIRIILGPNKGGVGRSDTAEILVGYFLLSGVSPNDVRVADCDRYSASSCFMGRAAGIAVTEVGSFHEKMGELVGAGERVVIVDLGANQLSGEVDAVVALLTSWKAGSEVHAFCVLDDSMAAARNLLPSVRLLPPFVDRFWLVLNERGDANFAHLAGTQGMAAFKELKQRAELRVGQIPGPVRHARAEGEGGSHLPIWKAVTDVRLPALQRAEAASSMVGAFEQLERVFKLSGWRETQAGQFGLAWRSPKRGLAQAYGKLAQLMDGQPSQHWSEAHEQQLLGALRQIADLRRAGKELAEGKPQLAA